MECVLWLSWVLAAENDIGQIFVVDITLKVDLSYAGQSDDVKRYCKLWRGL